MFLGWTSAVLMGWDTLKKILKLDKNYIVSIENETIYHRIKYILQPKLKSHLILTKIDTTRNSGGLPAKVVANFLQKFCTDPMKPLIR